MKLGYKLMLFGLVAMVALPMFMIKPDGTRMMTLDDWMPDTKKMARTVNKVSDSLGGGDVLEASQSSDSGKIYSWKDQNGVMHFSEEPPPEGVTQVKERELPKSVNLMAAVKPRVDNREQASSAAQRGPGGFNLAFPSTVPVKDIPKLIDDAKQLQKLADQRNTALQEM